MTEYERTDTKHTCWDNECIYNDVRNKKCQIGDAVIFCPVTNGVVKCITRKTIHDLPDCKESCRVGSNDAYLTYTPGG
jgi:hypothetical protein